MPQPLIELHGGPMAGCLHIMPANGFPPQTYLPMLRWLGGYRCLSLPPRALWGDEQPPQDYRAWHADAADLLSGLERHGLSDVIAIGHSLGAVVSMLAVLAAPERFKALIMLDPVMLQQPLLDMMRAAWDLGAAEHNPLVAAALRRRHSFESREDAFQRFKDKRVFADWDEATLRLYVEHGLRKGKDGGYELCWSRAWEAHYFATVYNGIWQDLPRLNEAAPTLMLRASYSETFPLESYVMAQALLPDADFREMSGQGHLFPQAAPEQCARLISQWLDERQLS